jgi:hypothetical protein
LHLQLTIQVTYYSNSLLDYPFLKCQIFPILRYNRDLQILKYWDNGKLLHTNRFKCIVCFWYKRQIISLSLYVCKIKWTIFRFHSSVSKGLSIHWIYMYIYVHETYKKCHLSIFNLNLNKKKKKKLSIQRESHCFVSYFLLQEQERWRLNPRTIHNSDGLYIWNRRTTTLLLLSF